MTTKNVLRIVLTIAVVVLLQVIKLEGLNRLELVKRGRRLEYITIAWTTLEGYKPPFCGSRRGLHNRASQGNVFHNFRDK